MNDASFRVFVSRPKYGNNDRLWLRFPPQSRPEQVTARYFEWNGVTWEYDSEFSLFDYTGSHAIFEVDLASLTEDLTISLAQVLLLNDHT